jgi:hypothetical protein
MRRSLSLILTVAGAAWLSLAGGRHLLAGDVLPRITLRVSHGNALAVAFAPDGKTLASAGGSEVKLWDLPAADSGK